MSKVFQAEHGITQLSAIFRQR